MPSAELDRVRLRCLIGPDLDHLIPIEVNSSRAYGVKSDLFEGKIAVYIKYESSRPPSRGSKRGSKSRSPSPISPSESEEMHEYFSRSDRKNVTWSIQAQGRFLQEHSANDILFGNTFDRPLTLPWGTSAVLSFMKVIDPTLQHDLFGEHPWALSPLLTTMPYLKHERLSEHNRNAEFPPRRSISDDISKLSGLESRSPGKAPNRRSLSEDTRKKVTIGPEDIITTDFCYGFLTFPRLSLSLPAGLSFDLSSYSNQQPVRFVCCERHPGGFQKARTFWCVVFEIVKEGRHSAA